MVVAVVAVLAVVIGGAVVAVALHGHGHGGGPAITTTPTGSPTGSVSPTPGAALPRIGQCYSYTVADLKLESTSAPVVPCSRGNAQTFFVGTTPSISLGAVSLRAGRECPAALARALGVPDRDVSASLMSFAFYVPSAQAAIDGAHWYRCDAIADTGHQPLTLPADLHRVFRDDMPVRTYRACLTTQDRTRAPCSARTGYTFLASFPVAARRRPPQAQLLHLAQRRCPLPKGAEFLATFPSEYSWARGDQRFVSCWLTRTR